MDARGDVALASRRCSGTPWRGRASRRRSVAACGDGARAVSRRYAGSAGTGLRRVYAATRSAATCPAPTQVAPTRTPPETTTSTWRPSSGSLSRSVRWAGSSSLRDPHTPIVTTSRPCAFSRTTSLPPPGPGAGDGPAPHRVAARRRGLLPALRDETGAALRRLRAVAHRRTRAGRRRWRGRRPRATPRSAGRPAAAAREVSGADARGEDEQVGAEDLAVAEPHAAQGPVLDEDRLGADPDAVVDAEPGHRRLDDPAGAGVELALHQAGRRVHHRDVAAALGEPARGLEARARRHRGRRPAWR